MFERIIGEWRFDTAWGSPLWVKVLNVFLVALPAWTGSIFYTSGHGDTLHNVEAADDDLEGIFE